MLNGQPPTALAMTGLIRVGVLDAGLIRPQEPRAAAAQILSVTHGFLMLQIGGFVEEELQEVMPDLAVNLMVGLGADRAKAERSLARAVSERSPNGVAD